MRSVHPESALILLVEDRADDVSLIRKAFATAGIVNPLYVVSDGEQAIAYLMGKFPFLSRDEYPLPDLVLLDLKMPKIDGFETLAWIRNQPGMRRLPVLVLTCSEEIRDVNRAYRLGANSFVVKPLEFDESVKIAQTIDRYWLRASRFPQSRRPQETSPPDFS